MFGVNLMTEAKHKIDVIKSIEVYGEMHRYIPVLASQLVLKTLVKKLFYIVQENM